ncbi:MAG: hypothetical protein ABIQ93_06555, partial [Saprospiraceae bacterium]
MKSRSFFPLTHFQLLLLGLLFLLPYYGCTALGFVIGASIDKRQPKKELNIQGWEVATLRRSAKITIYRKDNQPLRGHYIGVGKMNPQTDTITNAIVIKIKGRNVKEVKFPFVKIDHVYIPARKATGRIIGPIIGLAVDLAGIVISISSISFDYGSLCPY